MKIYIASSWRNIYQPEVVRICRSLGFEVYDFRNPAPGNNGFRWSDTDADYKSWNFHSYREVLRRSPIAEQGFKLDMDALKACDICLLVMPSGRSAALETGFAAGAGKLTAVLYPTDIRYPMGEEAMRVFGHPLMTGVACSACGDLDGCWLPTKLIRDFEPELMVKMTRRILIGRLELEAWLGVDLKGE